MNSAEAIKGIFLKTGLQAGVDITAVTWLVIIILLLLLFTGIISGAEKAYFSLSSKDIDYIKVTNKTNTRDIIKLLAQPKHLVVTLVAAKSFMSIAIVICCDMLLKIFFKWNDTALFFLVVEVLIISFLLLLFGEILPKVYASQNNMRMALFATPVIKLMSALFSPISMLLASSRNYVQERIDIQRNNQEFSEYKFEETIELIVGHTASQEEIGIFKGIIKFSNITVRQIMHGRLDVSAVPYGYSFSQLQNYTVQGGYSRMPVYNDSLDNVIGMIYAKDLLPFLHQQDFDWHALIKPAYYVHENKYIEELLNEFQQKNIHFAIVVDEFGGTSGIVTLEDIMEEIIGDIKDEFDDDDLNYKKIDEQNYIFEGKTLINDVCRIIGEPVDLFNDIRGGSDSLAGLILEISGKFPSLNETIDYNQFHFVILEVAQMRIKRIKLTIDEVVE